MRRAQIIGLSLAAGAGLLAFVGMNTMMQPPPPVVVEQQKVNSARVLVARSDIGLGEATNESSFRWQDWPSEALSPSFITHDAKPNAPRDLNGAIARSPILMNEPITDTKLIQAGKGGVLSAILPAGKRAISTKINDETAVGKMILPNDHVDVILTQRKRGRNGADESVSETLFRNIRVLAIGQQIEVKDGKKNAEGTVATLELTPGQAERLALANFSGGEISLALRSVADLREQDAAADAPKASQGEAPIQIIRYGVKQRAYGVN